MFPGTLTEAQYRKHLQAMKDANMNIVRCWGGANVQKDSFFEICDELGLMVWQEFPLACNCYEGTPAYLYTLSREARSIVRRLSQLIRRPHRLIREIPQMPIVHDILDPISKLQWPCRPPHPGLRVATHAMRP